MSGGGASEAAGTLNLTLDGGPGKNESSMTGGPFTHEDENGRAPCAQQLSVISCQLSVIGLWPAWGHRHEISPLATFDNSKELPLGC
jgi:hypothetical protein